MDLVKPGVRKDKGMERGGSMSLDLRLLALQTRVCPFPDVFLDARPHISSSDESSSSSNAWM